MKKKIFRSIVAVLLLLTMLPAFSLFTAATEDDAIISGMYDEIYWEYNMTTCKLTISGTGRLDGKFRSLIEYDELLSVVIDEGITSIATGVFSGCINLHTVSLPTSLTVVEENAFSQCWALKRVYISDIAAWCNIVFKSPRRDPYSNPLANEKAELYLNGEVVTDLVIPDTVTKISDFAFYRCKSLVNVVIPEAVTEIGISAFFDCPSLKRVTIPNTVTKIGLSAFLNCDDSLSLLYCGTQEEWNTITKGEYSKPAYHQKDLVYHPTHKWDSGTVVRKATETETGLKSFLCSECAMTKTEVIEKLSSSNNQGNLPADTTPVADTSTESGCGSSLVSPWSALVLVALLPFAFLRKKKETE